MNTYGSHWIVEHDILTSQLQQHRIVEEFVDADILTQTLKKINKLTDKQITLFGDEATWALADFYLSRSNWNLECWFLWGTAEKKNEIQVNSGPVSTLTHCFAHLAVLSSCSLYF